MGATEIILPLIFFVGMLMLIGIPRFRRGRQDKVEARATHQMQRDEFELALEQLPKDSPEMGTRVTRGWCLLLTGNTDAGLAELKQDGGTLPGDPRARLDVWLSIARAMALTNADVDRATALSSKVRHALGQLPTAWHAAIEAQLAEIDGWMQLHRGQSIHALASFDRAIEHPTGKPWIDAARLYGRACALIEMGRYEQGKSGLEDAAALGPDRANVSRAHALLEEMKAGPYRKQPART